MNKHFMILIIALLLIWSWFLPADSWAQDKPKDATSFTKDANAELLKYLPFDDTKAFDDAKKGFIAPLPTIVLKGEKGNLIWDPNKYGFIKEDEDAPGSVNPSLWRQSKLINISGLFKVRDGIYQVRNYDLSNITFIEGSSGIIVVDPLISAETAKAGLELYFQHRPKKPVVAVIYTHSHVDHYGGVKGVVSVDDVNAGKVKIYAPLGFLEHAVAENVMAGNTMSRRASYMYGNLLPPDIKGQVGAGLGTTTSAGTVTLIPPTNIITKSGQIETVAGLEIEFKLAPNSEAPSEMFFYIPSMKAVCTAEDATHTLHNTYSLRGAKIRYPLDWSKYLNWVLDNWSDIETIYAPHHWPVWGKGEVRHHLEIQRDMYRYINDQALNLANKGYTMIEIAEMVKLPESLDKVFSNRGYYGSMNHDVKTVYVQYLGWFDGNPATLHVLPPVESSKKYVEFMGGAQNILKMAQASFDKGEYRWVAQVVNHVVFADPKNQDAKNLQADALEQLGYQAESGPWRNFYLTGAQELRNGILPLPAPNTNSPDMMQAMTLELVFDYMGVRLNGPKAAGKDITLNFDFTDTKEKYVLYLSNAALSHSENKQSSDADASITLTRTKFNELMLGETKLEDAITSGAVKISGNQKALTNLLSLLDSFEFWFNIVTP